MSIISEIQSRKLGLIELLTIGFDVYLKNLKSILAIFCTIVFPFIFFFYLNINLNQNGFISTGILLILSLVFLFLLVITIFINFAAIAVITDNYIHGRKTKYKSLAKLILSRFIPLFLLGLRFNIICFLRDLLLFIPGLIYGVNNGYFALAFILRDQRGKAAFYYSRSIVKGNWWRVFFFSSVFGFVSLVFSVASTIVLNRFLNFIPFMNDLVVSVLSLAFSALIAASCQTCAVLLFLNLEFQKGFETNPTNL